jgi:tape measure domain-containing protein
MATKIGDLFFAVTANTSDAARAIYALGGAGQDAASIISTSLAVAFGAAAVAAATAVAVITYQVVKMGAAFNVASQQAFGLFTALTGSVSEATVLMREFAELTLSSPIFDTANLQRTMSLLLTFGVASDFAFEMAKNINLAAIALGKGELGAVQLARAIGQIQGRGWLEGDEARQLSEVGVNAYAVIAEAIGKTTGEVMKMGRAHQLLAEDVIPILNAHLNETFGPVAQNLLNTYKVQVQGLKNVLTGIGSAIVEPFAGRTGGGVLVEFIKDVREELSSVIEVGSDGTFKLVGALEPLNELTTALAAGFADMGDSFVRMLGQATESEALGGFIRELAEAVPGIVDGIQKFSSGAADFFGDLFKALGPVLPALGQTFALLGDFVINALPAAAEAVVSFVDAAAPIAATLVNITNLLLKFASPIIVDLLEGLATVFGDLADVIDALGGPLSLVVGYFGTLATNALLASRAGQLSVLTSGISGLATAFAGLAVQIGLVLAAMATWQAVSAGVRGGKAQDDFLYGDVPAWQQPFQSAGRIGRAIGIEAWGGDGWATIVQEDLQHAADSSEEFGREFAQSMRHSELSVEEFQDAMETAGLDFFAQSAGAAEYRDIIADIAAEIQAANVAEGIRTSGMAADLFEARDAARAAAIATGEFGEEVEEDVDILKELGRVANEAWDAVKQLLSADKGATIDEFLMKLPGLAENVTNALKMDPGILRDLDLRGATEDVKQVARDLVMTLSKDYGMSLDQIRAMLDQRGLGGVIEALGTITKETTQTVDPLIAKYGQLGASADEISEALRNLNEQRQTAIQAQIDQVEASLRDARIAAEEARDAVKDFLSGGYLDSPQQLVDQLIGDIGGIGSSIEDALKQGGVRGEAAARLALGDLAGQLAEIVNAGFEQGLSGAQIVDLIGPVMTAINEEVGQGANRISSLDWTEGITPNAGSKIMDALMSGMDPGAIQDLINNILGADASVAGLEARLESLQAEMSVDAEFSQAQVQAALDEIHASTMVEPVVTPEAAQLVFDAIQDVLNTEGLEPSIDKALMIQQILDAAKEAERQISLVFDSNLSFDTASLHEVARAVGEEFYAAFNDQLMQIRDQRAQEWGFENYSQMQQALGPAVAAATIGGTNITQTIQNDIRIDGSASPISTASEIVAASSAAAGSGGRYDPGKYYGQGGQYVGSGPR